MDRIARLIDNTVRGRSSVLLLEGPAGIGKSRIITEATELAKRAGLAVGTSAADELGEVSPLRCFVELLENGPFDLWPRICSPACPE
jgi:predicted ATPase